MDAAVAAVLSKMVGIFTLNEEQRTGVKAFLAIKDVFSLLRTGFGKSLSTVARFGFELASI